MSQSMIGAQLFTLREHLKTPEDIDRSFARLAEMGYQAVQVSALGPIEPEALGKLLKKHGLTCAATHVSLDLMRDTPKCVDYHRALDCRYAAIGGAGHVKQAGTLEAVKQFADEYSRIASDLASSGISVGYHNHAWEFAHVAPGQTFLAAMMQHMDEAVWFELDTYWIAAGGADPAAWIDKATGRAPCIHLKDMLVDTAQQPLMCEVGGGNLNWPAILAASQRADVQWYLIERDRGEMDPFESLQRSLDNLHAMGVN